MKPSYTHLKLNDIICGILIHYKIYDNFVNVLLCKSVQIDHLQSNTKKWSIIFFNFVEKLRFSELMVA